LLLQVKRLDLTTSERELCQRLLRDHLKRLGDRNLAAVAQDVNADVAAVRACFAAIRRLTPKPGASFSAARTHWVVPEVTVVQTGRDTYDVRSNDKVRLQRGFLDQGAEGLRPLTLDDIAADVGVHVSTVQRAVAGKHVDTPHGIYEIAYFFPSGVRTVDGGPISSVTVQARIKALVALEDRASPLSDPDITKALRDQGVAIARETVKKYRTAAGVPPRHGRLRVDRAGSRAS
jgi:DNA-directed RNA polymerase specialized sigma54-like protein